MINYKTGDIVLVEFIYSEGKGSKKRPSLIISSNNYHRNRQEVIIAAITSNIERALPGDTRIKKWEEAGLLYPSSVTGIIQTIKASMVKRKLGSITKQDCLKLKNNLTKSITYC